MQMKIIFSLFLVCCSFWGRTQNAAARYEIDAKRLGVSLADKDALPRGREFVRLDSTYYVGWLYQGFFKYDRSADYLGFQNAIEPLKKAFILFDNEFAADMRNLFSSQENYTRNGNKYGDIIKIAQALKECYENTDKPDSVMWVLDKILSYKFQKDFFGAEYQKAWTYHRNRFYTKKEYAFLGNSVEENEKLAFNSCYHALATIDNNASANATWFGAYGSENDKLYVYHYLAIIHCYVKNYDSAEHYYNLLQNGGLISWNNYGGMQNELGNFALSKDYFNKDMYGYNKMLKEPYYYLPTLNVFAGNPKNAIDMSQGIIQESGSTPGFGWYNIALARAYMYDGQLDSAALFLDKAANFREVHIGTTLTQKQYDFTIQMLKLMLVKKRIDEMKFFNKRWWYSPKLMLQLAELRLEKMSTQYVIANILMNDPERSRLIYDLFCAEGTTTYDEAWYLINDMSPKFFIQFYEGLKEKDKRENVKRYFDLFAARMQCNDGNFSEGLATLTNLVENTKLDVGAEKLFLARLYEGLCHAEDEKNNTKEYNGYLNIWYEQYPQLMPYGNLRLRLQLNVGGVENAMTKAVIAELKNCNIDWVDSDAPSVNIQFETKGNRIQATINTQSAKGKKMVGNQKIVFNKADGVGKEIALRIYNKGGSVVFDNPVSDK